MKLSESTITLQMQKELDELMQTKLTYELGGRKSPANTDNQIRFATAVEFLHDIYEYFDVTVFSEIKANQLEEVKQYILKWNPTMNIGLKIDAANTEWNKKKGAR